jgi:hypothetical protein
MAENIFETQTGTLTIDSTVAVQNSSIPAVSIKSEWRLWTFFDVKV